MDDDDKCRTCGDDYDGCGDGYDGECPSCADRSYMDEELTATAPRWAWEIIIETLEMDTQSKSFDTTLRKQISEALESLDAPV